MVKFNVSFDESQSMDRATKLLAGLGGNYLEKAANSAMARATQYLKTQASKRVRQEYAISNTNLRLSENIRIKKQTMNGLVEYEVSFSKEKIPLYRYNGTTPSEPTMDHSAKVKALLNGHWRTLYPGMAAKAHQKRSSRLYEFEHAFVAKMKSGHVGIFERVNAHSSKIREIMGSSVFQMVGNETIAKELVEDAREKFEERLDHEVNRILAGLN